MATHSYIGIKDESGQIRSIYCHFDGHVSTVGELLYTYYNSREKVEALINLGSISYLEPELVPLPGVKHTFNKPVDGVTVAYHRDRGDSLEIGKHSDSDSYRPTKFIKFVYLYDKDWYVWTPESSGFVLLQQEIERTDAK